ncbi:MAG: SBBP repeat-containing protein [Acidobacteria bacterium]|nr:SBBP repeat-containing protein [Acidobacteriota bacterium]
MTIRGVEATRKDVADQGAVLRMRLVGANPAPEITGMEELPGKVNYFIGNDPEKWRTNVATYAKVLYEDVYPGIDVVYYGNQRQLEYDFVVAPGADPRAIRLAFLGTPGQVPSRDRKGAVAEKEQIPRLVALARDDRSWEGRQGKAVPLRLDGQGDLVLGAGGSELRLHQPVIYQEISGARHRINGNFVIQGTHQVGFEVARYDASKPLVIDPVLDYSTYLGGSGGDLGFGIAVDAAGNAYVAGITRSLNFPTANPYQAAHSGEGDFFVVNDAFVTKLDSSGSSLVYSTYLGGDADDRGYDIAVDSAGNAYVTGGTDSTNFPTASPLQSTLAGSSDAFVTKLNPDGSALAYSTYLGGSSEEGLCFACGEVAHGAIAVDSAGNAYVTGFTFSSNFPTANPFQPAHAGGSTDAFVTKLSATGAALVYSTYLGGSNEREFGLDITVDADGQAYIAGQTFSTDFPTANPLQATLGGSADAFITKLDAAGSSLLYSTYLGGSGFDNGFGVAVDGHGNAYVTGSTNSSDFPTARPLQAAFGGGDRDAFLTKLNASGSPLVYSTYLGGNGRDFGDGIAVDHNGNAYVTGQTDSR